MPKGYYLKALATLGTTAYQYSKRFEEMPKYNNYPNGYMLNMRRQLPNNEGGQYMGRFRGPKHKRPRASLYTKFGITTHREYAFVPEMDDVLYIGASSFNHTEMIGNLGVAIVRRLFLVNSIMRQPFLDVDEIIRRNVNCRIGVAFYFRSNHSDTESVYFTNAPTAPLTNWFFGATDVSLKTAGLQLGAIIQDRYFFNSSVLHKIAVWTINATNDPTPQEIYNVEDWMYKMYSCVSMKLQNVTPADAGTVLLSNDITANPLQGSLYRFSGITPKVSNYLTSTNNWGVYLENQMGDDSGIIHPDADPGDGWNTIPPIQQFKNCSSEMKIRLAPGHIKYTTVKFKFTGSMQKLLLGLFGSQESALVEARDAESEAFGTSFVFALEKVMRTGSATIKANCQLDVGCGCVAIPKYKMHGNIEVTIGAVPPQLPSIA